MANNRMSYDLASEMERIFNSDEHKAVFGTAANIEKLAFSRVSDEDKLTSEIEIDLLSTAGKEKCCECASKEGKGADCKCECHPKESKEEEKKSEASTVEKLLAVSEELDGMGFERLAGMALKFASLVVEAKAKKSDKKAPKKSEKDKKAEKEKAKAKADKAKAKEKKEKAEQAKADKEKAKAKADKEKAKSSKKSSSYLSRMKLGQTAGQVPMPGDPVVDYSGSKGPARTSENPPAKSKPNSVHGNDVDIIKAALPPQVMASIVSLEAGPLPSGGGQVTVKLKGGPGDDAAFNSVQSVVQQLQNANKLSAAPYKVVGA
jgi:hypothetical protein